MVFYAPGKAANAGGVAVSGLEMAQNSQRLKWTPAEVDAKLKDIMVTCCQWPLPASFLLPSCCLPASFLLPSCLLSASNTDNPDMSTR